MHLFVWKYKVHDLVFLHYTEKEIQNYIFGYSAQNIVCLVNWEESTAKNLKFGEYVMFTIIL